MKKITDFNRRQFLITTAVVGGAFAIGIVDSPEADAALAKPWEGAASGAEFTPWLSIMPDDTILVRVATPEIGNGAMTQTAMTIAEELESDWSKMQVEGAPAHRNLREGGVYSNGGGSLAYFAGRSTTDARMKLSLQVGASARERLKAAAAAHWRVPVAEVTAANSVLTHTPTGRKLTYGQVAVKAAAVKLKEEPALKPQSEWKVLGHATPAKLSAPAIANGSAVFGMDVRVPGMVYAAIRQSPVHGGRLKSFDASAVKKMPGVIDVVVVDPDEPRNSAGNKAPMTLDGAKPQSAIAVVAEHYWQAAKALEALPVEWTDGPGGQWKTYKQMRDATMAAVAKPGSKVMLERGDISGLDKAAKIVEADYFTPYSDQVTMEPLNGTALVNADGVEVWHPSQHPEQSLWVAADEAGVSAEKVKFNQTYVGGGFGRRVFGNDTRMVVAVAKKVPGRPVHVVWSREESIRQGRYRPLVGTKFKAALDANGMPEMLLSRAALGDGGYFKGWTDSPYSVSQIKNVRLETHTLPLHLLTGPYRGPGYNSFAFMYETFIDECAHAAGKDPLEYRLKLLEGWPDSGWAGSLKEAATKAGWGKKLPKGMGQGIAIANWAGDGKPYSGTTVAAVATVEVAGNGQLKIHALDVAFDTGRIVNKDAVLSQLEGGTIFGLNMAMNEELTIENGRVVEGNYDTYPMMRMADMPAKINIHFGGLSGHERFSEVGEPPVGVIGPAVGNAIFAATGHRLRTMPFRKLDLNWA